MDLSDQLLAMLDGHSVAESLDALITVYVSVCMTYGVEHDTCQDAIREAYEATKAEDLALGLPPGRVLQ